MSSCNEMLIRLHIYRANLCVHIQVLLIHSIAEQLANLQVVLPYIGQGKRVKLFYFMKYDVDMFEGSCWDPYKGVISKPMHNMFYDFMVNG